MPVPSSDLDTRTRILQAALLLFRQRGYHGVGINDILIIAKAPKGSLYHHFPGGKDQMAVEVIELVTERLLAWLEADPLASTATLMRNVGSRLRKWMQRTAGTQGAGACALIASFAAEGETAVAVATAAKRAYERIADVLARRLEAEGWAARAARDDAFLVIATLEGGGLVSQTMGEPRLFTAAIERAAALCEVAPLRKGTS
jgi:TetR/AcrR family transcriptional regulator, lmrAB and yxaGH operons repressor